MPCRSDYMEPNSSERRNQATAKLCLFFMQQIGWVAPDNLLADAEHLYCTQDWAPFLCQNLRALKERDPEGFDNLVYNAKNPQSRKLADWWEAHEEFDKKRVAEEEKAAARAKLAEVARGKLTNAEFDALGQHRY